MKRDRRGPILLLITAIVWGMGFVAQTSAMDSIETFTFLGIRFVLGALVLVPAIIVSDNLKKKKEDYVKPDRKQKKLLLVAGLFCGVALFAGAALQQLGITAGAETGKAGFLTAMYILLVPIFGLFFKKKVSLKIWICVLFAIVGIYFLSVKNGFAIEKSDFYLIACAVAYSVQIMLVDYYVSKVDAIKLSALEFLVTGIISLVIMAITEHPSMSAIIDGAVPILYAGICSSGIGYTFQIIGQKYSQPAEASLIMSLESTFALIGGIIILHQKPEPREWIGMGIMFVAIMVSQISPADFRKN